MIYTLLTLALAMSLTTAIALYRYKQQGQQSFLHNIKDFTNA